jgi:hypothetical protein
MEKLDRTFVAALCALLVCACAPQTSYVKVDEAFNSIALPSQRSLGSATLCMYLTDNSMRSVEYLNKIVEFYNSRSFQSADVFDPRRIAGELTETLNARFRQTVRVASSQEATEQKCDVTMAFDMKIEVGTTLGSQSVAAFVAKLYDRASSPIDTLTVDQRRTVGILSGTTQPVFVAAWKAALTELGEKIDKSGAIKNYVASLPKTNPAVAVTDSQAVIDLALWDSVKGSSRPTDFQAYLQKFPNGAFAGVARSRLQAFGEPVPTAIKPLSAVSANANFGNYRALVIGIDNYKSVTPLKTAVNDARAVADLLTKSYGFQVKLLLDATRNQMLDAFDDLRRELKEDDNLIIYYAGHGYLDTDSDRGFWLPADADGNRRANWLSNGDIADTVRAIRAKHVMVVADSCYAGTLTRNLAVEMSALDDLSRLAQKRARTALVSGGLEPVEDAGGAGHSIFAMAFLDALQSNTGIADMSGLFSSIRRKVLVASQQTPQYGDIRQTGHEGGDFIFVK